VFDYAEKIGYDQETKYVLWEFVQAMDEVVMKEQTRKAEQSAGR